MKITVVYVFPIFGGHFIDAAERFIATYNLNPPGIDHQLLFISNGGPPSVEMRSLAQACDHEVDWFEHDNRAYDISAFQAAAQSVPCDMMVFFGNNAYLRGEGWLKRMAEAFVTHGPHHLYGCMGNDGDSRFGVAPHIRTTGFFTSPMMMNLYPMRVTRPEHRYPAEHGPMCLTSWFKGQGHRAIIVTWTGEHDWPWDAIPGGFHQGDQHALLSGDKNSCPPYYPYS